MISLIIQKVRNRLSHEKNRIWRYLPVGHIPLRNAKETASKDTFCKCLSSVLGPCDKAVFEIIDNSTREQLLKDASAALQHKFVLLGNEAVLDPIDWHTDFISGHTWAKGFFYKDYNVDIDTKKIDGKVPWELSRCHHLLWLGEAYCITGEEKYAQAIVSDISDWINENPLMHSVNWTCSMDVAIRAVNWLYALWLISESDVMSDAFIKMVSISLYQHGFFISNNLEKNIPYSNNHYAADLMGLLYIGAFFQSSFKGRTWFKFATRELFKEVDTQVLPSGAHFERSISYHRLMVELFSSAYYLWRRKAVEIPAYAEQKISCMYTFVFNYIKPNGFAPLIEDNDDGRFLPFVKRDFRSHAYLLDENSLENRLLRNGLPSIRYNLVKGSYADAGHWIFRDRDAYVFLTNGGQSRHQTNASVVSTHTHNDLLSFELALGEDDLVIDPGTYRYVFASESNPEGRNEFRSTKKHNTIMVDGEEQHELSDKMLFVITKNAVIDTENSYHTLSGLKHKRTVDLKDVTLIINDFVEKQGDNHHLQFWLHFANGVSLHQKAKEVAFETEHYKGKVSFPTTVKDVKILDDTVSPSYGVLVKSQTVEMSAVFSDSTQLTTCISWERK